MPGGLTKNHLNLIKIMEIMMDPNQIDDQNENVENGIISGERYIKDNLVAASGIHFWTDIVFHIIHGIM